MFEHEEKISAPSPPREFNIVGSVIPEQHYYVDLSPQIKNLLPLIEKRIYFVINRPRQFGKITVLDFLAQHLQASGKFAPALISFEDFTSDPTSPRGNLRRSGAINWRGIKFGLDRCDGSAGADKPPAHFF